MKIAIVHDELVRKGGAEQVVISFAKSFPKAPIYTLSYNQEKTYPYFRGKDIRTSFFGKFVKNERWVRRLFFPFGIIAMHQLDLSEYDVVLQSTTHCSKYVKVGPNTLVLTYCHTPFRLVWRPESYSRVKNSNPVMRFLFDKVIGMLKHIDYKAAQRTDHFITNSNEVVPRILSAYGPKNGVAVIHPSVKMDDFYVAEEAKDYYLMVSRFEPYKKVDLVIEAFNQMPDKKLIIVGKGSLEDKLKKMAGSNVTFLSNLDSDHLAKLFAECRALIFPQHEDYGITPLEAAASGRPVIAYGAGGVLDTMVPYKGNADEATALFFHQQTVPALHAAIEKFEQLQFNATYIKKHAERFREESFIRQLQLFVRVKYADAMGLISIDRTIGKVTPEEAKKQKLLATTVEGKRSVGL